MSDLSEIIKSPSALVGLSAFLMTFVASVMADEQNERLRQGSFGAIAGSAVGGLAAVMQQEPNLFVLDALASKPEYRTRITAVVFGRRDAEIIGRHWISYSGQRQSHTKRDFTDKSIAYQVIASQKNDPCLTTMADANKEAQDRGQQLYSSFLVFRLNENAALSLDWPGKID